METALMVLGGFVVLALIWWGIAMYLRKRFVILYHSKALDELTSELRGIRQALERAHPKPEPVDHPAEKTDGRQVSSSMFGR